MVVGKVVDIHVNVVNKYVQIMLLVMLLEPVGMVNAVNSNV